jgi:hypothetical protein
MKNPKVSKVTTTYLHHETKIKCEVDATNGSLTLWNGQTNRFNSGERNSFTFIDSKPETIEKVAKAFLAFLEILKAIK